MNELFNVDKERETVNAWSYLVEGDEVFFSPSGKLLFMTNTNNYAAYAWQHSTLVYVIWQHSILFHLLLLKSSMVRANRTL